MRFALSASFIIAALFAPLAGAGAAPQALGLVATGGAVPLICSASECAAQFSTFCLQEARDAPVPGTAYRPAGPGLSLIAIGPDGARRRLPGQGQLAVTSLRGFAAVKISMPADALATLGAVRVAVEVTAGASLLPVPVAGDPMPQTAAEIAVATGPYRTLGQRLVDNAGRQTDALRLTSALVNALPDRGRVGARLGDETWRRTVAAGHAGDPALDRAAELYGTCRRRAQDGYYFNIRRCLEQQHDDLLLDLNQRFWRALAGS